jgi:putative transposase
MDGRGRALDNVFIERLWWSVKYENVYLMGYETVAELKAGLTRYFDLDCRRRPDQSLDNRFPWAVYSADRRRHQNTTP